MRDVADYARLRLFGLLLLFLLEDLVLLEAGVALADEPLDLVNIRENIKRRIDEPDLRELACLLRPRHDEYICISDGGEVGS